VKINPIASFDTAGLHPAMLRNVQLSGFDAPTPIQKFTLPAILQGYDVIGIAQTGKCIGGHSMSRSVCAYHTPPGKDLERQAHT